MTFEFQAVVGYFCCKPDPSEVSEGPESLGRDQPVPAAHGDAEVGAFGPDSRGRFS